MTWNLDPEASEGFRRLVRFWSVNNFGDIFVTSGQEGTTHLSFSFHYTGRAFDLRFPPKDIKIDELRRQLLREMGPKWEMIEESDHLHFELNWS